MSAGPTSWDDDALRDPHGRRDKAARVEAMFDAIAPTYERVNSLASFGRDAAWRRRAIAAAGVRAGDVVLDIACGTGDMIRAFSAASPVPAQVIGVDFAAGMLAQARFGPEAEETPEKARCPSGPPVTLLRGDALRLPLAAASVDVVSCAFGVRNFQDLGAGLAEMRRVMRPGGRLVILEFTMPESALLRWPYRLYTELILPRMGALISRDRVGAYKYLPSSVRTFEPRAAMIARIAAAGFVSASAATMNFGGVALYRAEVDGD